MGGLRERSALCRPPVGITNTGSPVTGCTIVVPGASPPAPSLEFPRVDCLLLCANLPDWQRLPYLSFALMETGRLFFLMYACFPFFRKTAGPPVPPAFTP